MPKRSPPTSGPVMSELDPSQSKLLGALTIAAAQRLGDPATLMLEADNGVRKLTMARIDDIVLLDHPADVTGPRSINAYLVDVLDFDAGKKFKIDPQRLLYSLQWQHNATPPDLHLQLVQEPREWFDRVASTLFGALNRDDPHLFDALRAH